MYGRLLAKYPWPTKMLTSGILFSLGDVISQFIEKKEKINFRRNAKFFLDGCFFIAPCLHMWYCKYLPKIIAANVTSVNIYKVALIKTCYDQLLFAPILLFFFGIFDQNTAKVVNYGSQKENEVVKEPLTKKEEKQEWSRSMDRFQETLVANWKIWPIASTINFLLVPLPYQVLFANFVGLFWNVVLSNIVNRE